MIDEIEWPVWIGPPVSLSQNLLKRCVRLATVLKFFFINVSYHILVASLTLMALF